MNLISPLITLENADLVRSLHELEVTYQFKHNLIQESAYASLLRNDRRALHRACAEALEHSYPASLDDLAALLARHYGEAGDDAKTFEYARRAGTGAMRVHALSEALMHYDTAALLAARLPISTADFTQVHLQRGRVLEVMGRYDEAVDAYETLEATGEARGEPEIELGALLALATVFIFPNTAQDVDRALVVNTQALELARAAHDEQAEAQALWNMQQQAYFSGHPFQAVAYSKQALALADRLGLVELRAYILNDASRSLVSAETVTAALQALAEARMIWREVGNLPMLADNLSTTAETAHFAGKLEMAEDYAHQARELSEKIGNLWNLTYSTGMLMQVCAQRGESAKTFELCDRVLSLAKPSGFYLAAQLADILRALLWGELGDPLRGIELLNAYPARAAYHFMDAWRYGAMSHLHILRGELSAAHATLDHARAVVNSDDLSTFGLLYVTVDTAELALREGHYEQALAVTRELEDRLRQVEIRYFLPQVLRQQGHAYLGLDEPAEAERVLSDAARMARDTQARFDLWEILAAQSELAASKGDKERAQELRGEARAIVSWIAAQAPPAFRTLFLAQPRLEAVLDSTV